MKRATILGAVVGGTAAFMLLSGTAALAQMQVFPPGADCSKLPQSQQTDCNVQQHDTTTTPDVTTPSPTAPVVPGDNGTEINQNGILSPNEGSGQTHGGNSGNGGAGAPGQSGN